MIIPGVLISLLTFPGVIVHELAHQIFCRLTNTAVLDVCYFRLGNPSGYVLHEKPKNAGINILIGVGPFFLNSILGAIIALPAAISGFSFGSTLDTKKIFICFLAWLGISIAMHSFPSTGDAKSMWKAIKEPGTSILTRIVGTPIIGLIYLGAAGSVIWLDLVYGVGVSIGLSKLLISIF